jgi:hypothetical protein
MKKLPKRFQDILSHAPRRWPKERDRLLRRSDDWSRGVTFTDDHLSRHVHLWDGFLSAADGLVELCMQDGYEHECQSVIYPILYNYRQGLELAMKWHIFMYGGRGVQGIIKSNRKEPTHDLWWLWKRCREIIEQYGSPDKNTDDAVERIVQDFHELDKTGITFRYGWTNDGKVPSLPDGVIDLENIRDVMKGVASYFDGLDGWLSDLASAGP